MRHLLIWWLPWGRPYNQHDIIHTFHSAQLQKKLVLCSPKCIMFQTCSLSQIGLIRGLPIRFAYFRQQDVMQLTNPSNFYFAETAIGVEGHGLARLGTGCYLTPLNSKMDDSCHMEVNHWEG